MNFKLNIVDKPKKVSKISPTFYKQIEAMHDYLLSGQPVPVGQGDMVKFAEFIWENIERVNSQCFQDIWVLYELKEKRDGYFVEFGAGNGLTISNTLLLEQDYGWKGILAEPNPNAFPQLKENRPNVWTSPLCVTDKTGYKVNFIVSSEGELSTRKDLYQSNKPIEKEVEVDTITIGDLLAGCSAPDEIDYLSIDTEGGEYETLKTFFDSKEKYQIKCITVEHNFKDIPRAQIKTLLENNGYTNKFPNMSAWDDFYIKDAK